MCLTCGCGEPNKKMGEANITYDDVKRAADENGLSVSETVDKLSEATTYDQQNSGRQA